MSIPLSLSQWLGGGLALLVTLGLLSYILFGGHELFRLLAYAFIGAAAGYLTAVVLRSVFFQRVGLAALQGLWPAWVALGLAVLLWMQPVGRLGRRLSGVSLAVLTAVSAAVLLGGAARGTLVPLSRAAIQGVGATGVLAHLVGLLVTVAVLASFHFGKPAQSALRTLTLRVRQVGQVFLGLALAAIFVGVFRTALFVLTERIFSLGQLLHFLIFGN
ncbi:MAG: hypothetical protein GXO37_04900 [Chloroflexi bacterium]|nr:hypothetical protein [Chloroflexota bacterium]